VKKRKAHHHLPKRCHPALMVLEAGHRDGMGLTETIDRRGTITGNGIEDIMVPATSEWHDVLLITITILDTHTLNIIIATGGGRDPVPQRDGTETFGNGIYRKKMWSSATVCRYRN